MKRSDSLGKSAVLSRRRLAKAFGAAIVAALPLVGTANAQDGYPVRPVNILVGSSAGGGGDLVARAVGEKMSGILGQPVVVENRPGASGNIGAQLVAEAAPDGYTVLFAYTGHVINPGLFNTLPFDPIGDFIPVTMLASTPHC